MAVERVDFRCTLKPKPGSASRILGKSPNSSPKSDTQATADGRRSTLDPNIMSPLYDTNGILFPYTPIISGMGESVNYEDFDFTHTNYTASIYKNTRPNDITITADFTAQTDAEARYMLAVIFFLRSTSKSYFGEQTATITRRDGEVIPGRSGLPPPVLLFNYLGSQLFNNVPVIIKEYAAELKNDVDYVPVARTGEDITYVPTHMTFTIVLGVQQNPHKVRTQFNLDTFRRGGLLNKGFI